MIYLIRALHYFLKMAVILAAAFGVMYLAGWLDVAQGEFWNTLFMTRKGWIILGLVVVLALTYPVLSFTTVTIAGDFDKERSIMDRALEELGFRSEEQDGEHTRYRLRNFARRLSVQFDDEITITGDGKFITISGHKKYVGRAETYFMHYRKELEPII